MSLEKHNHVSVNLSLYPKQGGLKYTPDHGGNRTFGMLAQFAIPTELHELVTVHNTKTQQKSYNDTVKPHIKEPVNFDFRLKCFLYNMYLQG